MSKLTCLWNEHSPSKSEPLVKILLKNGHVIKGVSLNDIQHEIIFNFGVKVLYMYYC